MVHTRTTIPRALTSVARTVTPTTARARTDGREPPRPAICLGLALRGLHVDEHTAARFAAQRGVLWRSLLGYLPAIEPVCALARDTLARELCPGPALDRLHAAARLLRERDGHGARAEFASAREAAAAQLGPADPDGLLCDRLLAELMELDLARDAAVVPIAMTDDVVRFSRYVTAVRLDYDAAQALRAGAIAGVGPLDAVVRALRPAAWPLAGLTEAAEDALRLAVGRFDPRGGLPFSACVAWWIGRALDRTLAADRRGRLPPASQAAVRSVRRTCQEFRILHGRSPCADELALFVDPIDEAMGGPSFESSRLRLA